MAWYVVIMMMFVACDSFSSEPTLAPTVTPTPLTDVRLNTTQVPAGLPDNPLQMVLQPKSSDLYIEPEVTEVPEIGEVLLPASSTQAELDLEQAILDYSSVTVDIVPVARPVDALQALCDSSDTVSAAWVDRVSFSAALSQNCGEPILVVRKRIDGDLINGESGLIILNRNRGTTQLSVLNSRTFCRLSVNDFFSWLLPLMIFRANNIDPANFEAIIDFDNEEGLVKAVAEGECTGAGLSTVVYNDIIEDNDELAESINLAFESPPIPHAVLMYPVEMQLGIRVSLTEGVEQLADDDSDSELLSLFLGQDDLQRFIIDEFAEYNAFLEEVGLDFSILGN